MSIRLMTKVWDESPYDGTKLLLHLAMADTAHDDGTFFASQKVMADKARCSIEYVRLTIRDMEKRGLVSIVKRGSSKGLATVYRLSFYPAHPNTVGESESETMTPTLPKSDSQLPNFDGSLPKSDGSHPSFTSILPIHNGAAHVPSTEIVLSKPEEQAAKIWWEKQTQKPIGKNAWFSLVAVCKAAIDRGYPMEKIVEALDYIGTVPSMRQMDLILRGKGVAQPSSTAAMRNAQTAIEAARVLQERGL